LHTATHCNTLQHPATPCNILQHTATHCHVLLLRQPYDKRKRLADCKAYMQGPLACKGPLHVCRRGLHTDFSIQSHREKELQMNVQHSALTRGPCMPFACMPSCTLSDSAVSAHFRQLMLSTLSVLYRVAVCPRQLQYVAECCSMLQCVAQWCRACATADSVKEGALNSKFRMMYLVEVANHLFYQWLLLEGV